MPPTCPSDVRHHARRLFSDGWSISAIARHLHMHRATVASWKARDGWEVRTLPERLEDLLEQRLRMLIAKDHKEGKDYKEIDLLGRQIERLIGSAPKAKQALTPKPARNTFSEAQSQKLKALFLETLFDYQQVWYQASPHRSRNILKSRQIGATWYFAREALLDALDTGRNQLFLSASKAQAHVFKQYVVRFAKEAVEVELRGDPIILANGATLYFLGTNTRTAQSYHGNLYFDEYFWVPQFTTLNKVASGMAMQARWRKTYFSTPSSLGHDAYTFWSGAHFNKGRSKAQHIDIDISHDALQAGKLCADGQWRQIVTIDDALAGGCNLFDISILQQEYSASDYANLLQCAFIDDTASVFPLADLKRCMVDTWEVWEDFKPLTLRPLGDTPVWIGYDPALSLDAAGCVVLAPPAQAKGIYRVLEKHQWRGIDFEQQAKQIQQLMQRYHVSAITMDITGIGQGVFQLVKSFFPAVRGLHYSPEIKARLVMKGRAMMQRGRLQFDAGASDLAKAFMAIRETLTPGQRQVTYTAARNKETGHADLAWACLHALDNAPLEGLSGCTGGFLEFY